MGEDFEPFSLLREVYRNPMTEEVMALIDT
jgi:hypothetical protein